MTGGSGTRRFFRAVVFGVLAGVAGALLWLAVRKLTGYEIGLIAVVVGFAVGAAVRKGSDDRGGVAYQLLAVFITYCCIVSTYVPEIYAEASKEPGDVPEVALMIFSVIIAFIAPVLMGFQNIIGMLIIAFALWEAWKINKYKKLEFQGPFTIAGAGGGAMPPPPVQPAPPRWSDTPPPPPPSNNPPPPPPQLGMT
jgi:MFS family permease